MWLITLRDLQYRLRRLTLGVVGAAVVYSVTLLLGGLSSALHGEADRAVEAVGADAWIVREGASGPFSALAAMPDTVVDQVAKTPGVTQADPYVMAPATTGGSRHIDVTVIGYRPGGLGPPVPTAGRQPSRPNEAMVDRATGYGIGDRFTLNGLDLTVVGQVDHMTLRGGVGDVYLNIRDAQSAVFRGNRIVMAIVVKGRPVDPPGPGLKVVTPPQARSDMLRPFRHALHAADLLRVLLWAAAVAVVGATTYLSALDRVRELAVLKALGATSRTLATGLAVEAMLMSVAGAALAVVAGFAIAPLLPLPVYLSGGSAAELVGVGALVGLVAGPAALSHAIEVDPARAFGA